MGIPWDEIGINCYVMGQTNMPHGQSWELASHSAVVLYQVNK